MDYHKTVSQLFDYFYAKKYRKHFKLDLDRNKHREKIDSFVRLLANHFQLPSVGINYLLDYFSYSFAYWHSKKTRRDISLGWIIGKKMFTKWLERKEGTDYYTGKFLLEHDIDVDLLRQRLYEQDIQAQGLDPAEELEKVRFPNSSRLYNCLAHTTLYYHRSIT